MSATLMVAAGCSVALGYDEGTVLIKIGREEPVASMDSSGKIIWARHSEIQTVNVKSLGADFEDVRPPSILVQFLVNEPQIFGLSWPDQLACSLAAKVEIAVFLWLQMSRSSLQG